MATRPCGAVVAIFGIESADFNCSCGWHTICGTCVKHDTLVRFEKRLVEGGKNKKPKTCGVALLVSDGVVQCCVGRLPPVYDQVLDHLDGRIAQVVARFSDSNSQHKIDYNLANNGVCLAVLVDTLVPGDRALEVLLDGIDLDSSSDEN